DAEDSALRQPPTQDVLPGQATHEAIPVPRRLLRRDVRRQVFLETAEPRTGARIDPGEAIAVAPLHVVPDVPLAGNGRREPRGPVHVSRGQVEGEVLRE